MKSTLIKDTTKAERIALIKEWIPIDDGLEDCDIDLWDMYRDYIDGKKEIAEINAEFQAGFQENGRQESHSNSNVLLEKMQYSMLLKADNWDYFMDARNFDKTQ